MVGMIANLSKLKRNKPDRTANCASVRFVREETVQDDRIYKILVLSKLKRNNRGVRVSFGGYLQ